ncbi:MAG: UMP kinase [Thaumarchaeota archaeon]|nr:UMP kinase [Candidatus Calditenuaceae archaeon]MDW8042195.1 UMP kinase [Nitrososphaerota archaeon]
MIKLGGHLFARGAPDVDLIRGYARVIRETHDASDRWVVVVGGGDPARTYIQAARTLGADEVTCDEIAITVTRIHAALMLLALGEQAYPEVVKDIESLRRALAVRSIAVAGGLWPGQSTFAVSAVCAGAIRADRLIVATDVRGVYDRDPKLHADAKLIPSMTYDELLARLGEVSHMAGEYRLVDSVGLTVLKRSRVRLLFVDGTDPENVRRAVLHGEAGTTVEP